MRVLMTGGTGFIGGRLLTALAASHDVAALTREEPTAEGEYSRIDHDLAAPIDRAALPKRIDAVIHLAQSRRYREFPEGAEDMFAVNTRAAMELLEYARLAGASRFVLVSTGGIYARSDEPIAEGDTVGPTNMYFRTKYAAELLARQYEEEFALATARPFFVYGPGQEEGMLVPGLSRRVLAGEPVTVAGNPGMRINPLHVGDAVRAFEALVGGDATGTFNIAGGEVVTIGELATAIGAAAGIPDAPVEHSDEPPPGDLVADTKRMRDELGVEPTTTLSAGLPDVIESLREGA